MTLYDAVALFAVMFVLAVVPSSSVALVVTRSATKGFRSGAAVAAGIVLGDLVFVLLAILGMNALAEALGGMFLIIRYLAGAYLIWLGVSLLRSKSAVDAHIGDPGASGLGTSFLAGLLVTLGDIKAIFFYASVFPVFVDMVHLDSADITAIVVITLVTVGGAKLAYAGAARTLASFAGGVGAEKSVRIAAGGLLASAGAFMIVKV